MQTKPYDPIVLSVNRFGEFFPLIATHFTIKPSEGGEAKDFILTQMPTAGVYVHGTSKVIVGDGAHIHQLELYRRAHGKEDHLFTINAVNIFHPQPTVLIDTVNFGEGEIDITQPKDVAVQEESYRRALRYSLFFKGVNDQLGKKPEERRFLLEEAKERMAWLTLPIEALRAKIEAMELPANYPKKGEVMLKEIPRALNPEALVDMDDPLVQALIQSAVVNDHQGEIPAVGAPAKPARPKPAGEGTVVQISAFRGQRKPGAGTGS